MNGGCHYCCSIIIIIIIIIVIIWEQAPLPGLQFLCWLVVIIIDSIRTSACSLLPWKHVLWRRLTWEFTELLPNHDPSVSQVPWGNCMPWWVKFIICRAQSGNILRTSPWETTLGSGRNLCKDAVWLSGSTGTWEANIDSSVSWTYSQVHLSHPISSEGPYPIQSSISSSALLCFVDFEFYFSQDFYLKNLSPFGNFHCWLEIFLYKVLLVCLCACV